MALNLDDVAPSQNNNEPPRSQPDHNGNESKENEEASYDLDTLSDEALLQAVLDNPELFP